MAITPTNLIRHELIGLKTKIVESTNPANVGIEGKVVDETYKTIVIKQKEKEKRVFKAQVVFEFKIPSGKKVKVRGSLLEARPWDRIKKKYKNL
jgi:ribonuclease P protein subunit POP4